MKKLYGILLASLIFVTGILSATINLPKTITNNEEYFLWLAFDQPKEFDPAIIKDPERTQFIEKGLKICTERANNDDLTCEIILSQYFRDKEWHAVSNSWSYEVAKRGVACGMVQLAFSYAKGLGVIQDRDEAYKWAILSFAAGDNTYKDSLDEFIDEPWMIKCREKAKEWSEKHLSRSGSIFTPKD